MKIKHVCQQTGLTDRVVRYYIEEGLIAPAYTENYLGRRSFDFTREDVDRLGEIAVLRKFDFSIPEIREIYDRPEAIGQVLAAVRDRKAQGLARQQELLQVLIQTQAEQPDSVSALAAMLAKHVEALSAPSADSPGPWRRFLRGLRAVGFFLLTWLPPALCLVALSQRIRIFHYPIFDWPSILLTLLSLWPSALMLLLPRLPSLKGKRRRIARTVISVCCLCSLVISPLLSLWTVSRSETTDIRNYRRLDPDCIANRYDLYQALFPTWPHYFENVKDDTGWHAVYLDAHYLYRYLPAMDYTYDIYAEWPLDGEEYAQEVARVKDLFSEYSYVTVEKGAYTCLIVYDGTTPFEPVTGSYTYYIFAYNDGEQRVRYLLCDSLENGVDQPYYLELAWD